MKGRFAAFPLLYKFHVFCGFPMVQSMHEGVEFMHEGVSLCTRVTILVPPASVLAQGRERSRVHCFVAIGENV